MADIALLTKLIEPEAQALGLSLVRVAMFGGKSDPTLQIMAERPDTRQLAARPTARRCRAASPTCSMPRIRSRRRIGSRCRRRASTGR